MIRRRESLRLENYDYAQPGYYFVTMVIQDRACLLGRVVNGKRVSFPAGDMVEKTWMKLGNKFPEIQLDSFVIMPNHFHGVLILKNVGANPCVRPTDMNDGQTHRSAPTLGRVVQWFKTMTTNEYMRNVHLCGWAPFRLKLWQRNYYERVIRDEEELFRLRKYIQENPLAWDLDPENPHRISETEGVYAHH